MWTKAAVLFSACMWAGCTSATSAAASGDDDDTGSLEVAATVHDPGPRGAVVTSRVAGPA
jgi:hypothetical protein